MTAHKYPKYISLKRLSFTNILTARYKIITTSSKGLNWLTKLIRFFHDVCVCLCVCVSVCVYEFLCAYITVS